MQSARDLTSQVTRIDRWSFAWGGSADIYKGKYLGRTVSINQCILSISQLKFIVLQVAVKIMKGFPDSEAFNVRLYFPLQFRAYYFMLCILAEASSRSHGLVACQSPQYTAFTRHMLRL
jgi:hypothetical protein